MEYPKPLPEGRYVIRSPSRTTSVLDLGGGLTQIVANYKNGGESQQWDLKFGQKGYIIRNVKTNAYLSYPFGRAPAVPVMLTANYDNPVEWDVRKTASDHACICPPNLGSLYTYLWGNDAKENAKIGLSSSGSEPCLYAQWDFDLVVEHVPKALFEGKMDTLEKTIEELKGDLSLSRRSVEDTQTRLATLESSMASAKDDIVSGQESVADIRNQLSTISKQVGLGKRPISPLQTSYAPSGHLVGLGQKFPALEARTEKLAKSFGQTQDYLIGVQKFLQMMRSELDALNRSVPASEKADKAVVESLSNDLSEVRGLLEALDDRVGLVEGRTSDLSDSLGKICGTQSGSGSPIAFPSHSLDTPGPLSVLELEAAMSAPLQLSPSARVLPPLPERLE